MFPTLRCSAATGIWLNWFRLVTKLHSAIGPNGERRCNAKRMQTAAIALIECACHSEVAHATAHA